MNYDVIIIGAGPAGLTAAIYTSRARLKTLIIEKGLPGGLVNITHMVENYPGFPDGTTGIELMDKFRQQAEKFGSKIINAEVKSITPANKPITVKTTQEEFSSATVIIASGTIPRKLNVPGEEKLTGKGVSYCATCDGPFFRGKDVAVAGCGNSGVEEGTYLLKFAKSITFIASSSYIRADAVLQERVKDDPRVKFLINREFISVNGKSMVESVTVKDRSNNKEEIIPVSGLFIYKGGIPTTEFLKGIIDLDNNGYIKTDRNMNTSVPGIFAAGDVCAKEVRQIATACGEGVTAAISAEHYLAHKNNVC